MTTTTVLAPLLVQKFWDNVGNPLAGGLVYTYAAGSSTPAATYTDSTGGTTNSNPIVLNSRGECSIWILPNVSLKINVTDSSGNQIPGYPVDQVTVAQLITLWAGTDTGSVNSYILNFTANFTSLTNGIVLFWVPANSNTGTSNLNVNGLGVIPITNLNGSNLAAGQLVANQLAQVVYYGGNWILIANPVASYGVALGTFGPQDGVASATTTDLGLYAPSHVAQIGGTTTITSFGSSASILAPIYTMTFSGSLTLTYNSLSLILPGSANIQTQPGDWCLAQFLGGSNWKVLTYQSANVTNDSYLTSAFTTIVTTYAATGLSVTLNQIGTYQVRIFGYGYATGGTSDGIALQFGGTSTWTGETSAAGQAPFVGSGTATVTSGGAGTSASPTTFASVASLGVAANDSFVTEGILSVTVAGTLLVNAAQVSGPANTSALGIGTYMIVRRL